MMCLVTFTVAPSSMFNSTARIEPPIYASEPCLECDVVLGSDDRLLLVACRNRSIEPRPTYSFVYLAYSLPATVNVVFCNDRTAIVDDGCVCRNYARHLCPCNQCSTAVNVNGTACNRTVENQLSNYPLRKWWHLRHCNRSYRV